MPEYRHSKPSPDPLMTYQVVTYDGQMPIMVSCKIKGAAHIRSAYGEDAAGEQQYCPTVARMVKAQAIAELKRANSHKGPCPWRRHLLSMITSPL